MAGRARVGLRVRLLTGGLVAVGLSMLVGREVHVLATARSIPDPWDLAAGLLSMLLTMLVPLYWALTRWVVEPLERLDDSIAALKHMGRDDVMPTPDQSLPPEIHEALRSHAELARKLVEVDARIGERVRDRTLRLATLYEVTRQLAGVENEAALADLVLRPLVNLTPGGLAGLLRFDGETSHLHLLSHRRLPMEIQPGLVRALLAERSDPSPPPTLVVDWLRSDTRWEDPPDEGFRTLVRGHLTHSTMGEMGELIIAIPVPGESIDPAWLTEARRTMRALSDHVSDTLARLRRQTNTQRSLAKTLVDDVPIGLLLLDPDGRLSWSNTPGQRLFERLGGPTFGATLTSQAERRRSHSLPGTPTATINSFSRRLGRLHGELDRYTVVALTEPPREPATPEAPTPTAQTPAAT